MRNLGLRRSTVSTTHCRNRPSTQLVYQTRLPRTTTECQRGPAPLGVVILGDFINQCLGLTAQRVIVGGFRPIATPARRGLPKEGWIAGWILGLVLCLLTHSRGLQARSRTAPVARLQDTSAEISDQANEGPTPSVFCAIPPCGPGRPRLIYVVVMGCRLTWSTSEREPGLD